MSLTFYTAASWSFVSYDLARKWYEEQTLMKCYICLTQMPALKVLTTRKDKRRHDGTVVYYSVRRCTAVTSESRIVMIEGRGDIVRKLELHRFLFLSEYRTSLRKGRMVIRLMETPKALCCNIVQL